MALARYYPGVKVERPWLRLASWIGGDRDGNPYVTAEVTAETLRLHRGLAVEHLRRELGELSRRLSFSGRRVPPVPALQEWLASRHPLPEHVAYLEERYPTEPYRVALALLTAELAEASRDDMTAHLLSSLPHTARLTLEGVVAPLKEVARSLPPAVASDELETVRRQVQIFGLHAARLDIREDSGRVRSAVGEILRALDLMPDFERSGGAARRGVLVQPAGAPRPRSGPPRGGDGRHGGNLVALRADWPGALRVWVGVARAVRHLDGPRRGRCPERVASGPLDGLR